MIEFMFLKDKPDHYMELTGGEKTRIEGEKAGIGLLQQPKQSDVGLSKNCHSDDGEKCRDPCW